MSWLSHLRDVVVAAQLDQLPDRYAARAWRGVGKSRRRGNGDGSTRDDPAHGVPERLHLYQRR